jgi:Ca2+-binding EF-hand superfamily protein
MRRKWLTQCLQVKELFELYDKDGDESLSLNELAAMLQDIGNKITTLPAVSFRVLSKC